MNKQNYQFQSRWLGIFKRSRQSRLAECSPVARRKGKSSRNTSLVFGSLLLLESSLMQIATTADGSEVALNPSRETQLATMQLDQPKNAEEAVAGIQAERSHPADENPSNEVAKSTSTSGAGRLSLVTPANAASLTQPLDEGRLVFRSPLRSYVFTQFYSSYHTALDMAAPYYTPIYASAPGVVVNTGYLIAGGGLMVEVKHVDGYHSYYAHMSSISVSAGQRVDNSVQLGGVGATGWATGAHLHFMIMKNGLPVNPQSLLK